MKKKIWKKVLIIILIILAILLIDVARKTFIIYKIREKSKEYSDCNNYYKEAKYLAEDATVECIRKDNIAIFKRTSKDGTRMIYYGDGYNWIIVDTVNDEGVVSNAAVKIKQEGDLFLPILNADAFGFENLWQIIKFACVTLITTENVDGEECYKVYAGKDYITYVSKETGLSKKIINGSLDVEIIKYRLNDVKDEEVELPNLDGFKIEEQNN